ncbi:hypothetical protein N9L47_00870 [Rhodobacteraceae bacterium]|nr:hypothetical protein [Paracoccaceae bacterium]
MSNSVQQHPRGAASGRGSATNRGTFLEKMDAARAQRQAWQDAQDAGNTALKRESRRSESAQVIEPHVLVDQKQPVSHPLPSIETTTHLTANQRADEPIPRRFPWATSIFAAVLVLILASPVNRAPFAPGDAQLWYERFAQNLFERLEADANILAELTSEFTTRVTNPQSTEIQD